MLSPSFEFIVQSMPDLLFRFNEQGDFLQYYQTQNKSLAVPADQIKGRNLRDFFEPKIVTAAMECIDNALATGQETSFEYSLPYEDEIRYYQARMVPLDNRELICFVRDVTARHLIQIKNEELIKINDELDSFIYRASHDLRAPLSSILGLAEIGLRSGRLDEMKSCLAMIKERVLAQDHVIHEIIDYARNKRTDVVSETFNLKLLIFELIDAILFNEGADKIDFQVNVADDLDVTTDKIRLTILLSNLIANSVKYHDIKKENPFIKVKASVVDSKLWVEVEDNGEGILPDQLDKIFHMFYRASEKSKGSGLGLFIVKDIIEKMRGTINFQSVYREGSKFTFMIPLELNS